MMETEAASESPAEPMVVTMAEDGDLEPADVEMVETDVIDSTPSAALVVDEPIIARSKRPAIDIRMDMTSGVGCILDIIHAAYNKKHSARKLSEAWRSIKKKYRALIELTTTMKISPTNTIDTPAARPAILVEIAYVSLRKKSADDRRTIVTRLCKSLSVKLSLIETLEKKYEYSKTAGNSHSSAHRISRKGTVASHTPMADGGTDEGRNYSEVAPLSSCNVGDNISVKEQSGTHKKRRRTPTSEADSATRQAMTVPECRTVCRAASREPGASSLEIGTADVDTTHTCVYDDDIHDDRGSKYCEIASFGSCRISGSISEEERKETHTCVADYDLKNVVKSLALKQKLVVLVWRSRRRHARQMRSARAHPARAHIQFGIEPPTKRVMLVQE